MRIGRSRGVERPATRSMANRQTNSPAPFLAWLRCLPPIPFCSGPVLSSSLVTGLRLHSELPHPTGPLPSREGRHPAQSTEPSSPTGVPEVPLRARGPKLPPVESIPLVQSHLQTQGHEFSGSGDQDSPTGQVGRETRKIPRGHGLLPLSESTLCAQTCPGSHWLPSGASTAHRAGRPGVGVRPGLQSSTAQPSHRSGPLSCTLRDAVHPLT